MDSNLFKTLAALFSSLSANVSTDGAPLTAGARYM